MIALSIAWCSARHHEGDAMLAEMAGRGFAYVELSPRVSLAEVRESRKRIKDVFG